MVRHLLPDGRATDVLGVCLAWGETELVIDRDGAGPVTIRVSDVVTGKPVPPRPSIAHRFGAHEIELHVGSLWPAMDSAPIGTWLLRSSPPFGGRLRRRGNSALAMAEPGLPVAEAASAVRAFYAARGQDPLIQVQADSAVEAALVPFGFTPLGAGDAHCQVALVARALRSCTASPSASASSELEEGDDRVRVTLDGGTATGEAVLDGDWLGIHDVAVDPTQRRRGLATHVLAELLDWGASQGARIAWLHVETNNPGAIALYERLGFVTHHTNRYLSG